MTLLSKKEREYENKIYPQFSRKAKIKLNTNESPATVVIIGAGSRGQTYADFIAPNIPI